MAALEDKFMIVKRAELLICILVSCGACLAGRDVDFVSFVGDCTQSDMGIEKVDFVDSSFRIVTTGARFEYVPKELRIYQGLGDDLDKRLLMTVVIENAGRFEPVESGKDRVLLWSEKLNMGIYGDSTCIVGPKTRLSIGCNGNFKPGYEGRYEGELLLIDDSGGIEIYPQRYETGYKVRSVELGKKDWTAEYLLNADERMMIAAFPGKKFDWEKSFETRIVVTHGSMGLGIGNPYGQMPPDHVVRQWSKNFDILVLFFKGLYVRPRGNHRALLSHGPYVVENGPEFRRLLRTAHRNHMRVAAYCSLFSHYRKFRDFDLFYEQVKSLRDGYGIDGVYIDGLTFDYLTFGDDNKIGNWQMIRRLRELFGPDGVIILHGTHGAQKGNMVATAPNIDSYCTATLNGEGVVFDSANDPYVRYHVRKLGISNTIGMWRADKRPASMSDKDFVDALLGLNGRLDAYAYVALYEPPRNNTYVWGAGFNKRYAYYAKRLKQLKEEYLRESVVAGSSK